MKAPLMEDEILVHKSVLNVGGNDYEVLVFTRPDGGHLAKTFFTEKDVIINDGLSLEDTLSKHRNLLPLAVSSRRMLREFRTEN